MSLSHYVDVHCDDCGDALDNGSATGRKARKTAREDGWLVNLPGGRDLCPDCRSKRGAE
jgi:hypothetical protein